MHKCKFHPWCIGYNYLEIDPPWYTAWWCGWSPEWCHVTPPRPGGDGLYWCQRSRRRCRSSHLHRHPRMTAGVGSLLGNGTRTGLPGKLRTSHSQQWQVAHESVFYMCWLLHFPHGLCDAKDTYSVAPNCSKHQWVSFFTVPVELDPK